MKPNDTLQLVVEKTTTLFCRRYRPVVTDEVDKKLEDQGPIRVVVLVQRRIPSQKVSWLCC